METAPFENIDNMSVAEIKRKLKELEKPRTARIKSKFIGQIIALRRVSRFVVICTFQCREGHLKF